MTSTAGHSRDLELTLQREVQVALRRRAAWTGLASAVLVAALTVAGSFGFTVFEAHQRVTCDDEREWAGFGRAAAVRAMEHPALQARFLYRVDENPAGYTVSVVIKDGTFAGDTWVRDASGHMHHEWDVCRDAREPLDALAKRLSL